MSIEHAPHVAPGGSILPSDKLAYTVQGFCEALGIGKTKFYEEVAAGRIETVKIGARTLITVPTVRRYMASLEEAA